MITDTVLYCHTKKFSKTGQGHLCMVSKERADLKAMHDENDVLTDDELVVVRGPLRESRYGCLYIRNKYSRGFRLLNYV